MAISLLLLSHSVRAQHQFADKDFYLVDSLILEDFTESDLILVDSCLSEFHNAPHDTGKINALYFICENIIHSEWWKFQFVQNDLIERALKQYTEPTIMRHLLESQATNLNNLGLFYSEKGKNNIALELYNESLTIQKSRNDKLGIALAFNNMAMIFREHGNIPKALEYYHESLSIYEIENDKNGIALCLNNLGYIYMQQKDLQRALEFYKKSLAIYEELGQKGDVAMIYNNIAHVYGVEGNVPKALEYLDKGYEIRKDFGDKRGLAVVINNYAIVYESEDNYPKALEYHHKSLELELEIRNRLGIIVSLNNVASVNLILGNVKEAKDYALQGLMLAKEAGYPSNIGTAAKHLSKVAKTESNYQEALEMFELHIQMRDSIKNEATQKATIRQQTRYEFEKAQLVKEQEEKEAALLLTEETSRRDNMQYSVILIALLILGAGVLALGKISVSPRIAEGLIFFSFLILFEFLLVLADPYIEGWSGGAPGIKLLFNAGIAALIFPAHSFFEGKMKGRLVKN